WIFLALNLFMGVANTVMWALAKANILPTLWLFRLSDEGNVPTWYSSVLWLLVAGAWGVLAYHLVRWRDRRSWGLLMPVLFFGFISLDEVAQIHDNIGRAYGDAVATSLRTGTWV